MIIEVSDDTPLAWRDLIEGLALLSKGQADEVSPTYCANGTMYVCADPEAFTDEEVDKLDELGFFVDDAVFRSFRFGSFRSSCSGSA